MSLHGGTDDPDTIRRNKLIGLVLRDLRVDAGLSQRVAAEGMGVEGTVLGSYERGERGVSVERLILIAEFYRVQPAHLLQVIERWCNGDLVPLERREEEQARRGDRRRPLPSGLATSVVGGDLNR